MLRRVQTAKTFGSWLILQKIFAPSFDEAVL